MRKATLMLAMAACLAAPCAGAQQAQSTDATAATAGAQATPAPATSAKAAAATSHRRLGPFGRAMDDFTKLLREAGNQPVNPREVPAPATPAATPTPEVVGDDIPANPATPAPASVTPRREPPVVVVEDGAPPAPGAQQPLAVEADDGVP